jgi:hypothetical protein
MSEIDALDAEIKNISDMAERLSAEIWAICSPYEAYGVDQLTALGDRLITMADEVRSLEASRNELYDRLSQLYQAREDIVYVSENV